MRDIKETPRPARVPSKLFETHSRSSVQTAFATIVLMVAASLSTAIAQNGPPPCVVDLVNDDAVKEWNCRAATLVMSNVPAPPLQPRAMAIVQLAVSNAVNGMTGEFATYRKHDASVPDSGSVDGAAIGAAYGALVTLFPGSSGHLQDAFNVSLSQRGISSSDPGVIYGLGAGLHAVAMRSNDGLAAVFCPYLGDPNPPVGVWRPINNAPAALPCLGQVMPFILPTTSQFRMEGPPGLTSERYARDFLEVKTFGGEISQREQWQTDIATFWEFGSPVGIFNQVIRQVSGAQDMNVSEKARAFAIVYMVGADAAFACWKAKYTHLFWRPETAVNLAAFDSNPDTEPLPGGTYWRPLYPSHGHPDYPSGHSTISGSLGETMKLVFGDELAVPVSVTVSKDGVPITRTWNSLSEGLDELIAARVYAGLHFRFSDEDGVKLGGKIANYTFTHALRECNGNNCG